MSKEESQKRIDDYLLGRTSREDRLAFEEDTRQDTEIGEQIADTELAMAAIELAEDEAMKARLQGLESKLRQETPTAATTTASTPEAKVVNMKARKRSRMNLFGIAAALLLLLAAGWWIMQPGGFDSPGQLAMANFEPYPNIAYQIERSGGDADPEKDAYIAYEAGNFKIAREAFEALPATAVNKFYLGQSLLGEQNFAAAATTFREIVNADVFNLRQESEYYLALALAGQGETEQAIAELNTIVAETGHPSLKEAQALLEDLQ